MVQHAAAPAGRRPSASGVPDPLAGHAAEAVADMFKLLGDATRCRILYALLATPDLPVSAIASATGTSRTTVSAALRLLRTAGVVVARRDGREVHYRVADDHVAELLTVARQHSGHAGAPAPVIAAAPAGLSAPAARSAPAGLSAPELSEAGPVPAEHGPAPSPVRG